MTDEINLLSGQKNLYLKNNSALKKHVLIFLGICTLILSLGHTTLRYKINTITKQTSLLQQQLHSQKNQTQNKNESTQQRLQKAINKFATLEKQRTKLAPIFEKLHHGISANSRLTQLSIKNSSIKLLGETESMFGITHLIKAFSKTKYCANLLAKKISRKDDQYVFELSSSCETQKDS